jgi:hypothetical protein
MDDYPTSIAAMEKRFATQDDCLNYLAGLRWPSGYVCPGCGSTKGWMMENGLILCAGCRHQQSVIAGTVLQDSHTPLLTWFRQIVFIAAEVHGRKVGRIRLSHIPDVSGATLGCAVAETVTKGSIVRTDERDITTWQPAATGTK